jgi:outer membrane receptor protein involved in Fe transport
VTISEDSTGALVENYRDFSGNVVPSYPENNIYMSLAYSHTAGSHLTLFAKASYQGISGLWVDDGNTDKTNSYNLLNVLLGVDLVFGNFNIMASGGMNNIFNEVYVGFTNTNSANGRFYEAGAPRDLFMSLNLGYSF